MIVDKVMIENYKGLDKFYFKPARINVFVGRNNTGKSSILEAVALAISSLNRFRDSAGNDVIETLVERHISSTDSIKYLINAEETKARTTLKLGKDELKLELEYLETGYPRGLAGKHFLNYVEEYIKEQIFDEFDKILRLDSESEHIEELLSALESKKQKILDKYINAKKLFFTSYFNRNIVSELAYLVNLKSISRQSRLEMYILPLFGKVKKFLERNRVEIFSNKKVNKIPLFFQTNNVNRIPEIMRLYDILIRENRLHEALDKLRMNNVEVDDLRELEGELVCMFQNRKPLPLSFMGDGFIALVSMAFVSSLVDRGIVAIEEPETNMHPGYLSVVAEEILKDRLNQFFISTHNIEFIEYLLEKEEFLNEIKVIRLYRHADGSLGWEELSGEDARYNTEIEVDLRGI